MRKLRFTFAVAALAAAFGLLAAVPGAPSRAAEKELTPEEREKAEKLAEEGEKKAQDVATAYGLIDIARREGHEKPVALITAADILLATKESGVKLKAEGAGKGEHTDFEAELRGYVAEAGKMPGGDSDTAKALAAEMTKKIDQTKKVGGFSRGTAAGYTSTQVIVDAGKTVTIKRLFMGGTACTANVTKLVNVGVPLQVDVVAPDGKVFYHNAGNSLAVSWRLPAGKDQTYTIQVKNPHSVSVAVKVTTN